MSSPSPVLSMPTDTGQLGPGTLKVGTTNTLLDISCYVNNAGITVSKNATDQTFKLCGLARPGVTTYTYELTGNVDVDLANASGLLALSWDHPGTLQDFEFTPNNDLGVKFSGQLVIDPLNVQASEYGGDLTSDFTWTIVGVPKRTIAPKPTKGAAKPGDTFPAETSITASDSSSAGKLTAAGFTASPSTAWTSGQKITVGTFDFSWNGTAWAAGAAS